MKNFKLNSQHIALGYSVVLLMTKVNHTKEVVTKYKKTILKGMNASIDAEWVEDFGFESKVVLNPDDAYMLSEIDSETYFNACDVAAFDAGYEVEKNCCPLLEAESDLRKAQSDLLDSFHDVTGLKSKEILNIDDRKRFIELCLKAVVASEEFKAVHSEVNFYQVFPTN